jgi:beta-lactam-binding protein with PASTA domain
VTDPHRPHPPHWVPGWLTLAITGAAGFLLGVVVLVLARGVVHDKTHTTTITRTRTVLVTPEVPDVVGQTLGQAKETLTAKGYRVTVTGGGFFREPSDDDTVNSQDPPGGATVGGGATVTVDAG